MALSNSFPNPRKYRKTFSFMQNDNIVNDFGKKYCFSNSRTAKKTDFSSPDYRRQKVNCLNACFHNLVVFVNLSIIKTFGIDRLFTCFFNFPQSIQGLSEDVQRPSQNALSRWNQNRFFGINNLKTAV